MHQYLLPSQFSGEQDLVIQGEDFHYLSRVLRLKSGAVFPARTASGSLYTARISYPDNKSCILHLIPEEDTCNTLRPVITLYQGFPKGKKMDQIVRQATEAGVSRIVPVITEFCVSVGKGSGEFSKKKMRWEKIAKEAFQQSASLQLPVIGEPLPLFEVKDDFKDGKGLFCHEKSLDSKGMHEVLSDWDGEDIAILIGPEGGFSPKETAFFSALSDWSAIHFGPNILRTETAALYSIAAVQTLLQEKQLWTIQNM